MVSQLLAARVNLAAPCDQTLPLETKRLLLMELFVPLQRQGVGQHRRAVGIVATELDSDQALLVVQNMSPHIVCTTKRRRAALDRARKPFA